MTDMSAKTKINSSVKEFYMNEYPTDELGARLHDETTFNDVLIGLAVGFDIYKVLGAGDSIIRERVFRKLAEILGRDYEFVYRMWIS